MRIHLNIGQVHVRVQTKNAPASTQQPTILNDEKITICLCSKTWANRVAQLTCSEFLVHCGKLYNAHLEKKRVTEVYARNPAIASEANGPTN